MEAVYAVSKGSYDSSSDWTPPDGCALAISCRNVAAFSTTNNTHRKRYSSGDLPSSKHQLVYLIYVLDMDRPWETYLITSQDEHVQTLQWDICGTRLLVIGSRGLCQVWSMKDYLLNDWQLENTHCLKGEEIVVASWLHSGLIYNFLADKKDAVFYNDKYVRGRHAPSLSHFGGAPADGWLVVTSTGLICVCVILADKTLRTCVENLCNVRSHIVMADVGFHSDGAIYVAASDGHFASAIQCFKVNLHEKNDTLRARCECFNSFFPRCHRDLVCRERLSRVFNVSFLTPESTDTIVVTCTGASLTVIELWKLQDSACHVHPMFATSETKLTITKWTHTETLQHSSAAVATSMPRFPLTQSIPDITWNLIQYIGIAFRDRSVKLVNQQTFQFMNNLSLDTPVYARLMDKRIPNLLRIAQTYTGCGMLLLDSYGALVLLRPLNIREPSQQIPAVYVVSLLEYCMVSGFDSWDVVLLLKPGTVDVVLQRFTDNFHKQALPVQEYLYARFMAIKASLYRCSSNSQQRVSDCLSKLLLNSVATTFKSIFRPMNLASQDKSPADKLTITCSKLAEPELDKFIIALETKEFIVESGTPQSLQQLIQWVADFTLCLLSLIPIYQNFSNFPGTAIIRDVSSLATLRELLVVIRMWGMINPSCLPVFTTSTTNLDCLALMFKLLTKVWMTVKDGNCDFDEGLLDECLRLKSQLYMPKLEQVLIRDGTHYPYTHSPDTIIFRYGAEPDDLSEPMSFSSMLDGMVAPEQVRDFFHQVNLGSSTSELVKCCCRCGNVSLVKPSLKSAASKAWGQRWSRLCLCGGQWKRCDY